MSIMYWLFGCHSHYRPQAVYHSPRLEADPYGPVVEYITPPARMRCQVEGQHTIHESKAGVFALTWVDAEAE